MSSGRQRTFRRAAALCLVVEVGIQDADLEDAIHWKPVSLGRFSDRVFVRTVVYAVRLLVILRHVRMDPGDADTAVVADDRKTGTSALLCGWDRQAVFESAFDEITWHSSSI